MAKPEPIWTHPTRVTIAGGVKIGRAARNIRLTARRAVDASKEHGRCWLLDEQGGGVMFSHGELQLELFGEPPWYPKLLKALGLDEAASA